MVVPLCEPFQWFLIQFNYPWAFSKQFWIWLISSGISSVNWLASTESLITLDLFKRHQPPIHHSFKTIIDWIKLKSWNLHCTRFSNKKPVKGPTNERPIVVKNNKMRNKRTVVGKTDAAAAACFRFVSSFAASQRFFVHCVLPYTTARTLAAHFNITMLKKIENLMVLSGVVIWWHWKYSQLKFVFVGECLTFGENCRKISREFFFFFSVFQQFLECFWCGKQQTAATCWRHFQPFSTGTLASKWPIYQKTYTVTVRTHDNESNVHIVNSIGV